MRRIMKKKEYSFSCPVLIPPPLFLNSLRKLLNQAYWESHDLRPKLLTLALSPLFHPDYLLDQAVNCPRDNVALYENHIYEDPQYVIERIKACVKKLNEFGITEMTIPLFMEFLSKANHFAKKALKSFGGKQKTYYRVKGDEWEFLSGNERLFESRYAAIRNEPKTPKALRWKLLSTAERAAVNSEVLIPAGVLRITMEYVSLRKDGSYYTNPLVKFIDWDYLLDKL